MLVFYSSTVRGFFPLRLGLFSEDNTGMEFPNRSSCGYPNLKCWLGEVVRKTNCDDLCLKVDSRVLTVHQYSCLSYYMCRCPTNHISRLRREHMNVSVEYSLIKKKLTGVRERRSPFAAASADHPRFSSEKMKDSCSRCKNIERNISAQFQIRREFASAKKPRPQILTMWILERGIYHKRDVLSVLLFFNRCVA